MIRARLLLPLIAVIVAAVCVRLGVWQLDRLHQRRAHNAAVREMLAEPRLQLNGAAQAPDEYRRVEASGHWDYAHQVVLRQQTHQGMPGVVLITPLILDGENRAVMVSRGFVSSPDGMTLPPHGAREGERAHVVGTALHMPSPGDSGRPLMRNGARTWARLASAAVAALVPMPVMSIYVLQEDTAPRTQFPRRISMPALDDGPHLSYAIQWFGFAVIALGGAWLWMYKSRGSRVIGRGTHDS
jgi:surfeit locus 1 family protein